MTDGITINDLSGEGKNGFEISIDPIAMHKGLKEQIDKAESEIGKMLPFKPFDKFLQNFSNRFCDVCFFGKPVCYAFGEHLCQECADNMYAIDKERATAGLPWIKRKGSYDWWVQDRRRRVNEALFAAYGELAEYKVKEDGNECEEM